jgi:hypothetical protein
MATVIEETRGGNSKKAYFSNLLIAATAAPHFPYFEVFVPFIFLK